MGNVARCLCNYEPEERVNIRGQFDRLHPRKLQIKPLDDRSRLRAASELTPRMPALLRIAGDGCIRKSSAPCIHDFVLHSVG
jgi:hypothetical protein